MRSIAKYAGPLSLLFIILLADPLYAGRIYYINGAVGNDSYPGTESQPWRTIQKAANTMVAGDKAIVKSGTYKERVSETTSGSPGNEITFLANAGDMVTCKGFTISGSCVTVDGFKVDADDNDRRSGSGFYVSGDYVTIKNCYVTECPWGGIFYDKNSSYGYIYNNRCYHNGQNGISVRGNHHLVENNEVWESVQYHPQGGPEERPDADGIRFHGDHHTFRGNWIHEPALLSDPHNINPHIDCFQTFAVDSNETPAGNYCTFERNHCRHYENEMFTFMITGSKTFPAHHITIKNNIFEVGLGINIHDGGGTGGHDIFIYNNTFIGSFAGRIDSGTPMSISYASNINVKNNITVDYKGTHRKIYECTRLTLEKNLAYNTDHSAPSAIPPSQENELWAVDPKFIDLSGHDFHLQSSSPCVDAGVSLSQVTDDFDSNSRPQGSAPDIGAYEYVAAGTPLGASASASPVSGQAPLSVSFSGNASGGTSPYSYSWAFGDGGSSAAQNPSHTYSSAGTFSATLTVTDSASAIASKSVTITVSSTTGELVAAASADPIGGPTPLSVSFSGSASGGTAPYSYSWDFGDGTTSAAQNPGHVYSTLGNYMAILTVTDNLAARADAVVNISVVSDTTAVLGLSAETGAPAPGEGGTTNPTPGNHFYSIGSTVAVDSIPNTDYRFSKWTGDVPDESMFSAETTITLNTSKPLLSTFCTKCADVNGDLKITPSDAQLAFDLYLGKIPSPTWCELENADVNCSGTKSAPQITPADAQTIFNKYLQKKTGSSDCSGSSRAAAASQQSVSFFNGPFLIDISFLTSEGDILIPVIVESPTEMGAFGFDLSFPSDTWTYVGLEATDLTADCNQLAGNVISNEASGPYGSTASVPSSQFLRVGGFRTSDAKNASVGVLVTLVFKTKTGFTGPSEISVIATYDDLRNTLIYAGTSGRLRDTERGIENGRPADQRKVKAISR